MPGVGLRIWIDRGRVSVSGLQSEHLRPHDNRFRSQADEQPRHDSECGFGQAPMRRSTPVVTPEGSTSGHLEASAKVNASDRTMRAAAGPAVIPGIGRKVNTPATRISTSANA